MEAPGFSPVTGRDGVHGLQPRSPWDARVEAPGFSPVNIGVPRVGALARVKRPHPQAYLPLLAMLALLAGCGAALAKQPSPSSQAAQTQTSSAPQVTLSPLSLDFGSQTVNTSATQTVTLTNPGNAVLQLGAMSIGGSFSLASQCPASLSPNASCSLAVSFTPAAPGAATGVLKLADNAADSPQQVSLSGVGVAPGALAASPASVAFGTVTVGQSATQTIGLTNTGGESVTISTASTGGPGFALAGLSLPLTLAPNASAQFTVSFSPSSAGDASGAVYLQNTGSTATVTVALGGTAALPPHEVDLSWDPSTSDVTGYNVYRGVQSGGPYTLISPAPNAATALSDTDVQAGQTYYYVVTSVDADDLESGYSNEAAATIPTA